MDTMLATISRREAELALTTGRMFSTDEALKVDKFLILFMVFFVSYLQGYFPSIAALFD
jgi:hypothetical protein